MLLLAIETSCDETAAALLEAAGDEARLLSSVVATQHEFHARFGGIVPEIAARRHAEILQAIIADALERANKGYEELGAVAVVHGPGLIGSLVVGVAAAKAIALAREVPLVGVNHLEAHIYSLFLPAAGEEPKFPLLVLIASGGHTHLVYMEGHGQFEVVGQTRDDAAGEAFDKAGKLLDLEYPGGPALAALGDTGKQNAFVFPAAEIAPAKAPGRAWDFSFSGTKTALARQVKAMPAEEIAARRADLAAGFQRSVVGALVDTTLKAAAALDVVSLGVVGGVACNRRLREELAERVKPLGLGLHIPPAGVCTDNAAMVAQAGFFKMQRGGAPAGRGAGLELDCDSALQLENWH